jgi:subtilisin
MPFLQRCLRAYFAAVAIFIAATAAHAETTAAQRDLLQAKASAQGSVRVIVHLRTSTTFEHLLGAIDLLLQRSRIAAALAELRQRLDGPGLTHFEPITGMAATVVEVDEGTLGRLLGDLNVLSLNEDRVHPPSLAQSASLIGAPQLWASGINGSGQTIAVLDTGVDRSHAFFGGRVVEEMCYSTTSLLSGLTLFASSTLCPNGQASQTGAGAGVNCSASITGCEHGTHVAGIAAGFQSSSFSGIAPGARIIAGQVFSRFTRSQCGSSATSDCALSYDSDQIRALQRIYALRDTYRIAAVNLSIGGDLYSDQQACDNENVTYKSAIDGLRAVGIATVIATGNNGSANSISTPGCISSAFAVGSTEKNNSVSTFSNSASFVSFLAPGGQIASAVPGGGFMSFSGTSMATPHVAGTFALLRSARPGATVDQLAGALSRSGPRIGYARSASGQSFSYTQTRIDVAAALSAIDGVAFAPEPGWWWNPAEPGRGFAIEVHNGNLFFAAYLYEADGRASWTISTGPMAGTSYSGSLQSFANGQSLASGYRAPSFIGSPGGMSLQFTGTRTATLTWPGGTVPLQRYPFGPNGVDSPRQPFQPESGWWWNPAESGTGYTIEVQGNQMFMATFLYRSDGSPVWYLANGTMINDQTFTGTLTEYAGGQSLTGTWRPASAQQTAGTVTLQFSTTEAARLIFSTGRIIDLVRYRF